MPTIQGPKIPNTAVIGMENDSRLDKSRAFRMDFDARKFVDQIEIKGYRLAWQRAAECPCEPTNSKTQQPDPNCTLCEGTGWMYFRPADYALDNDKAGKPLDGAAEAIIAMPHVVVIRGIMTGLQWKADPYDKVGRWVSGMSTVTVRPENRIGYYDRLTNLDGKTVFSEVVKFKKGSTSLKTRYPVVAVNLIRTKDRVYKANDFELVKGKIVWNPAEAPKADVRVSLHYLIHPTWVIIEHPQSIRDQYVAKKKPKEALQTKIGDNVELPIRGVVQYDFLPMPGERSAE